MNNEDFLIALDLQKFNEELDIQEQLYKPQNVYENAIERLKFIFNEFDNIYLSFSGGKDSGVLLNITFDIARKYNKKFTLLYIDLEAMYKNTVDFVETMFLDNLDIINPVWICLPMISPNSVSMFEPWWTFWDTSKKNLWVRDMPTHDFIVNIDNHKFDFYKDGITFEQFIIDYAKWESKKGKTACLVGIRTDESLNRWRAIHRQDVNRYNDVTYSVKIADNIYNFYPIYDWSVQDIWVYNGKYNKPYNKLYDLMYHAGISLASMRVCEPFGDEQKSGLNLFKILEPETWNKIINRVAGANFGNIYCKTKATGFKNIKLPQGHTWKSYTKFLLNTLPEDTKNSYIKKFRTYIKYWHRHGSPLLPNIAKDIKNHQLAIQTNQFSSKSNIDKPIVRFNGIPDTIEHDHHCEIISWKRMAMTILKNDHVCKTLGFSFTKEQLKKRNEIIKKYKDLV